MATIEQLINAATEAHESRDESTFQQAMLDLAGKRRMNGDQREQYEWLREMQAEWDADNGPEGEEDEDEDAPKGMASQLAKYRTGYVMTISCSGGKSLSNGDDLAQHLEGKPLDYVLQMADQWTPIPDGTPHAVKYAKLNPGQRRMNAGNKLRAAWRKGLIVVGPAGIEAGTGE